MKKWLVAFYIGLVSIIAGMQIAGQILGFAGLFTKWAAILLAAVLTVVFYFWLQRSTGDFLLDILVPAGEEKPHRLLNTVGWVAGTVLILVLLLLPQIGRASCRERV